MAEVIKFKSPLFIASFPALFAPESFEGGPPKYGLSAVWRPSKFSDGEKKLWADIHAALDAESRKAFKKPWKDLPANVKRGLRDGAEKEGMLPYGKGTWFASLTTKLKPGVIDKNKDPIGPDHGNADEVYPGCLCRATVTVYSYDNKGKGVALGLMNVQVVSSDTDKYPRMDSRTDAAEDFEDEVDDYLNDADDDGVDPLD